MFIVMLLTILLVSLVITLALGFYVIITAPDEAINRTFASFIGMMILWILKDIAFWCFHKDNESSAWWGLVSFVIGVSLQIPLLLFAEVFPENNPVRWKRIALLAAPILLLIPLWLMGMLWENIGFSHGDFHIKLKPAAYVFGAYNALLLTIGLTQLIRKYFKYRGTLWGQQLAAIISGILVTGILIVPAGNLLPALGVYSFLPFSSVFIVAGTLIYAYAITSFKLFSLQTAVDQLRLFPITYKITIAVAFIGLLGFFLLQVPVAIWAFSTTDRQWQKFLVFAPIAGLIPALILILVIVRILSRPLRELTEKTLEVARGNYGAQIELARNDELGVLAKSFNSMSRQMAEDIARLKEINQALIRTEKLATAGTLATGVAHEVNNPLASISSLVQSLQSRAQDERDRETLRVILTQITRITSVLRSLMDFARPQTPARTATDLNQVIAKSIELARFDKHFKQLDVQVEFTANLPPLQIDSDQMQQVFLNLLLNARDAIDEAGRNGNGEIKVTTRREAAEVIVEISDNGVGISPENLKRIFDPFFSTKSSGKGTGLGLAVSHSIVAAHGGRINIAPQARGTLVTIAFPEV
ncbi:MAG TPA: ATP-binding protein [Blastocatellia bacterium]|nr:ATP-binding protein [Blastocatellia bacterium]